MIMKGLQQTKLYAITPCLFSVRCLMSQKVAHCQNAITEEEMIYFQLNRLIININHI